MKTPAKAFATSFAAAALVAASVGAAEATLTAPEYHGTAMPQETATSHLAGAQPTDPALRSVYFNRANGTLTITATVNRIDPFAHRAGSAWQRGSMAGVELMANGKVAASGTLRPNDPGVYGNGQLFTPTTDVREPVGTVTANTATNTYTYTINLVRLRAKYAYGLHRGETMVIHVYTDLFVSNRRVGGIGAWYSNATGPQFSFKY